MEYQPLEGTRMGGSAHSQVASLSGPSSSSQNNAVLEERKDNQQKQSVKPSFSLLSLAAASPSSSSAINSGNNPVASVSALSGNSAEDWNISSSSSPSLSSSSSPIPTCSPTHTPPNKYTPHSDLWFQDGSVILATESTIFRVHISVLSRHSLFFRDMFRLPQPPPQTPSAQSSLGAPSDEMELDWEDLGMQCGESRCPVVQLHDSAEDLASLLFALYDGPKFGNNDCTDFAIVSGILRLANKYLIDSLQARALEHLSIAWPSTLKAWDAREDLAGEYYVDSDGPRFYPSPVDVINLAREINAPSLLPSAFYDLSRYQFNQLLPYSEDKKEDHLKLSNLSLSDTQKLVLGKEASQYAITSLIRSMSNDVRIHSTHPHTSQRSTIGHQVASPLSHQAVHRRNNSCASAATCRRDVSELASLATQHYLFDRERGSTDPLYVAEELGQLLSTEMDGVECKNCTRAFQMWANKERDRLWRCIPNWFRLDSA